MNDILVDNNVAKNFCNPADAEYKKFIKWLFDAGVLVVTQRLLNEYCRSTAASNSGSSMPSIVDHLTRRGRLVKLTKNQLDGFRHRVSLRSNADDHDSVKAVVLSVRKLALSYDENFCYDVNHFPGHSAVARSRPEELPYAS